MLLNLRMAFLFKAVWPSMYFSQRPLDVFLTFMFHCGGEGSLDVKTRQNEFEIRSSTCSGLPFSENTGWAGAPFLKLSTSESAKPFNWQFLVLLGLMYSRFGIDGILKVRSHDVWFSFSLGHSVNAASVCHPGLCSPVMRLPNEAWRPGCRLWEPGSWSDPGTVDKQEDAYNRWDLILAPFTLKGQERRHYRDMETWQSLTLMSLPPYLKVQITLTSYVNPE